jgi:LysM repeat protein
MKNLIRRILKEEVEETSGEKHPNAEEIKKGNKTGCYTVNSGDQALAIAKAFGITLDDIKSLNGLRNANSIQPGQKLRVKNRVNFDGC